MKARAEPREDRPHEPARTPAPEHAVLQLQRSAGNQAVGRILSRRAKKPVHTGLRDDAVVDRFTKKAVAFLKRNQDGKVDYFAIYLGAAANEELAALGIPAVRVNIAKSDIGGAAQFDADGWHMTLDPKHFSSEPGVTTMGQLSENDAAALAGRVLHEARHAEQHFRIARLQAGEGKDAGFQVDDEVAEAAAAAPLTAKTGSAQEIREAKTWREDEIGEDGAYRELVTAWQSDAHEAGLMTLKVEDENAAHIRERLLWRMRDWAKPGGFQTLTGAHLDSAKKRKKTTIISDITAMMTLYAATDAAVSALPEQPKAVDFKPVIDALRNLTQALTHAYVNQPVEDDAFDVGGAVYDDFHKRASAP